MGWLARENIYQLVDISECMCVGVGGLDKGIGWKTEVAF